MATTVTGLTKSQRKNVEQFLDLFAGIELALKKKLHLPANNPTAVSEMIRRYLERNPYWTDAARQLWTFADIRNLLTHHRSTVSGYPVAVAPNSISALQQIRQNLLRPDTVAAHYRTKVETVSAEVSLAVVLTMAFENGFSQFPVVTDRGFGGLITENEITRWLGRRVKANSVEVNLANVSVRTLLKEKDPSLRGIAIFHFEKLDAPVEEVIGLFSLEPVLEVILLTQSGTKHTPLEGIITQWDAARFPRPK